MKKSCWSPGSPGHRQITPAAALAERLHAEPHFLLRYFCSPYHQDTALHPFIAQLELAAGFARDDSPAQRLDKLTTLIAPRRSVYDPPPYAQGVKVTGAETILFIAGQVAYHEKGGAAHPGDFKAQARAVLQAVKAQVEAGGGTMASIVKVKHLRDRHPPPRRLRGDPEEFFGRKLPASTMVAVAALAQPEFLIEVEAIAVI